LKLDTPFAARSFIYRNNNCCLFCCVVPNGNILLVKKLLGHKRIENTMKYTQLIQFKDDEFDVATATNVEEAKQHLAAGFDYVTEKNQIMLFRKPKRFTT